ncbi:MAG: lipopolysaccharide heptosyltransferase family protein [Alphaproteobacteria bacterium]|nr:MAG: lipopolysaccharide heptosyltransferase family protein [Alphaproteobacteria bacterium]
MRVLINRSDAIGDSILTSPMAKIIKEKFPEAKVTFIIAAKSADLFKSHPYVDDFKIYHRNARFYLKIREIINIFKETRPTHYFFAGGGYLPNFVAWFTQVKFRGGLKSRWHTYLFLNKGVRQKRSMVTMHEMEYNLNLLAPLGIEYSYKDKTHYSPEIHLTQDELELNFNSFKKTLRKEGVEPDRQMIFIHPGMTGHTLNWSSRNFARLILKFELKFPNKFLFIISYTPTDNIYLQGMKEILNKKENELLKDRTYFLNGQKEGLRHYMSILSRASVFVGPSTGTTHIAAVLGVPVVTIYSPIKVQSSLRWGPLAKNKDKVKILIPDVICGEVTKCALRDCPYYECMGKIEVEDVLKQAVSVMDI